MKVTAEALEKGPGGRVGRAPWGGTQTWPGTPGKGVLGRGGVVV